MNHVFLNGELKPEAEARLFADDRGFLYGDAVFTTLRCYGGVPFRLAAHVARLNASLASPEVGIAHVVDAARLAQELAELVRLNAAPNAAARLTVSRGRGAGALPPPGAKPTTLLTLRAYTPDAALAARGAWLVTTSVRRDPRGTLGRHKLASYAEPLLARREAARAGADEGLLGATDGTLLEGATTNLFAVLAGALVTPPTTLNLLPGIARAAVLECAGRLGLPIRQEPLAPERVARAEELFLTNALIEVRPVRRLDARELAPVPGPLTARLAAAYRELVARETAARA